VIFGAVDRTFFAGMDFAAFRPKGHGDPFERKEFEDAGRRFPARRRPAEQPGDPASSSSFNFRPVAWASPNSMVLR